MALLLCIFLLHFLNILVKYRRIVSALSGMAVHSRWCSWKWFKRWLLWLYLLFLPLFSLREKHCTGTIWQHLFAWLQLFILCLWNNCFSHSETEASFGFNRGAVLYKRRLYSYEMEPPFICLFAKHFSIWQQAYIVSYHPYSKS